MNVDDDMFAALDSVQYGAPAPAPAPAAGERQLDPTKNIELICENILQSDKLSQADSLRLALIAYRDHPPQDNSYITRSYEFTTSVEMMQANLAAQNASGGGDGPEAVTAGIKAALDLDWRPNASKMAVLIADAPPHGIGEYGDGFALGSPDGEDPLKLAREMAAKGISLFCVACEPALSGYQYGADLFRALSLITSAVMVPLTTANLLSHVIVGSALELMNLETLIQEVGLAVAERVHAGEDSVDEVAKALHDRLLLRNESTRQLQVESIYRDSDESRHNVDVFLNAPSLAEAKPQLKKIQGTRFSEKYLASRYASSASSYGSRSAVYPPVPPRGGGLSSSIGPSTGLATPGSPPRKVISEFKAFSAAPGMRMADVGLGVNAEQSVDDQLAQTVEMKFASISLEQAKRITLAAAWRTAPPRA